MLTALVLLAFAAADETKADAKAATQPARVADPSYVPQPGDRAFFDTKQKDEDGEPIEAWATVTLEDYKTATRLTQEQNDDALDKLEDARKLITFEPGTPVLVVEIAPVPLVRTDQAVGGVLCASVQVLSGASRGKTLYTSPGFLVQYLAGAVEPSTAPGKRKTSRGASKKTPTAEKKAATGTPDPSARAASSLKMAQSLEKAGKTKGATDLYRQLLKQYPNTPQAKTAGERLKALEAK